MKIIEGSPEKTTGLIADARFVPDEENWRNIVCTSLWTDEEEGNWYTLRWPGSAETPADSRLFAQAILAACDWAEKQLASKESK